MSGIGLSFCTRGVRNGVSIEPRLDRAVFAFHDPVTVTDQGGATPNGPGPRRARGARARDTEGVAPPRLRPRASPSPRPRPPPPAHPPNCWRGGGRCGGSTPAALRRGRRSRGQSALLRGFFSTGQRGEKGERLARLAQG